MKNSQDMKKMWKDAGILFAITLIVGLMLGFVNELTKEPIARQQQAASLASYREVCPDAESFAYDDDLSAAVEALGGGVYGTSLLYFSLKNLLIYFPSVLSV